MYLYIYKLDLDDSSIMNDAFRFTTSEITRGFHGMLPMGFVLQRAFEPEWHESEITIHESGQP